jgi:hypothetical protein
LFAFRQNNLDGARAAFCEAKLAWFGQVSSGNVGELDDVGGVDKAISISLDDFHLSERVFGTVSPASSIVQNYLREIRRTFYRDEKTFFQQRQMLIKALTLPARWLDKSKVYLPEDDYRRLLDTIISGIRKHGNLATVCNFAVYFLDCVQRHIKHHGDEFKPKASTTLSDSNCRFRPFSMDS